MICEIDFPDARDANAGERWQARFAHPHRVLLARTLDEVPSIIAEAEAAARDGHWVVGFVGYEAAPAFDRALQVKRKDDVLPLAAFAIYGYDEAISDLKTPNTALACGPWAMDAAPAEAHAGIDAIRAAIAAGDYYQVNYTARLNAAFTDSAAALYAALREAQPDGYSVFIDGGDWQIASVSPELFFDWTPDRTLTTRPMKGTAALGVDAASGLHDSAKERAENVMIVDLLRNDLARVAEIGSVDVTRLFEVEALPTALQMTSTVRCRTREETTLLDIFRALFPSGSVTGAPKVAAMQAIAALETSPRGAYCGAIGVIRPNGHATFNVGIRTVTVDARRSRASCGIGSGITIGSSAAGEYAEWLLKRRFLLRATASFQLIETLRLEAGHYWLLDRHLERLQRSATCFGFAFARDRVQSCLDTLAAAHAQGLWRVRLLLARDGMPDIECFVLEPGPDEVHVALATMPVDSGNEFLQHKTTERAVYDRRAVSSPDVFDTLLCNERGEITEFTRGNVVIEIDGRRVTPPLYCGLLPGVLRAEWLARGEVVEQVVMRADLARASGLWFINSVRGALPARLL